MNLSILNLTYLISFTPLLPLLSPLTLSRYSTTNVVDNLGSMFMMLISITTASIGLLLIKYTLIKYKRGRLLYDKLSKRVYFNMILRFFLEGYLECALSSLLNLDKVSLQIILPLIDPMGQLYQ